MQPLIVVPTYLSNPGDQEVLLRMLESLRATAPDVEVLLVDDFSPAQVLVDEIAKDRSRLDFELHRKDVNEGFSKAVNIGLRRALNNGQDAILVNADIEFLHEEWVERMQVQKDTKGNPASIVGGLLLYPVGLIQHAGIFFSMLHRVFGHRYQFGPSNLPEAVPACRCPVTGALQFIRHDCLADIGVYDDKFSMGAEDVDFCIRAFLAGRESVYQSGIRALHYESLFRGRGSAKVERWEAESWVYFMAKHRTVNFAEFCPSL